jgi:mannose-1-phosphate guanylyltransferase
MKAMVLAAGLGTRLRPITYGIPKPMAPVANRPIMEHILRLLRRHDHGEVVANLSYLSDQITGRFGDGLELGVSIQWSFEEKLLGTAGGVRNVREFFGDESFVVMAADALTDLDLGELRRAHEANDGIATLAATRVTDTREYGVILTGDDGRVQGFQEKPDPAEALSDLANCMIYVLEPEVFDYFPDAEEVDFALDVFPALLADDVPFYVHDASGYWNDVGSLDEYRQGNFDAITGVVEVEMDGEQVADGVIAGEGTRLPSGAELTGPVLLGRGCELGAGLRLEGPVVVGDGCRLGDGVSLRESVLLDGLSLPAGTSLARAVAAARPDAD